VSAQVPGIYALVGYGITGSRNGPLSIAATLLVEVWASFVSLLPGNNGGLEFGLYAEINPTYRNFLVKPIRGLHFPAAASILTSRMCCKNSGTVAVTRIC
jgi:hypothetical protein